VKRILCERSKTGLVLIAVLVLVLGPVLVSISNQMLDDRFQTNGTVQSPQPSHAQRIACIPEIGPSAYATLDQLVVVQNDELDISLRMANLMFSDQAVRRAPWDVDPQQVNEEDTLRRIEVLDHIKNGEIQSGRNLVYGAFIFQHGDCPDHYQFANRLAQIALDAGYPDARWIYAATLDRYLMSLGELQKYGTQYTWIEGEVKRYPTDPSTTDLERAKYNVPPLSDAMNQEPDGRGDEVIRKRRLETWWLTLIGASFAVLGAIIGIVDPKLNAPYGWFILGIAILTYLISIVGHYAQIIALKQGISAAQGDFWNVSNNLMIIVWFVCAAVEVYRVSRRNSTQPSINHDHLRHG
jgi:hypothetical protein